MLITSTIKYQMICKLTCQPTLTAQKDKRSRIARELVVGWNAFSILKRDDKGSTHLAEAFRYKDRIRKGWPRWAWSTVQKGQLIQLRRASEKPRMNRYESMKDPHRLQEPQGRAFPPAHCRGSGPSRPRRMSWPKMQPVFCGVATCKFRKYLVCS